MPVLLRGMARAKTLKVFRTPIGFHDAYVAAPSQKAALEAWGTTSNLFSRGEAELVTDAALTKAPLARPGEVIKRLRGTAEQHLAALPRAKPEKGRKTKAQEPEKAKPAKPKPRPSRAPVDRLEDQLADLDRRQAAETAEVEQQITALRQAAKMLEGRQEKARDALARKLDAARERYQEALSAWE